jgi:predicted ATPase
MEALLAEEDGRLIRVISKKASGLTQAEVRAALKRAKIRIDFPLPSVPGKPATELEVREGKQEAAGSRHEAAKRARETMRAQADAILINLIEAGFIQAPLESERECKGVRLTAMTQPDGTVVFADRPTIRSRPLGEWLGSL